MQIVQAGVETQAWRLLCLLLVWFGKVPATTIGYGEPTYRDLILRELVDLKPDVVIDPILWGQAKRIRAGKISGFRADAAGLCWRRRAG